MTRRVLVTGARAPAAVELALLFSRIGVEVHVADSTPLLLAEGLCCVSAGHRLPRARDDVGGYATAVAALVEQARIDLVVPTCEEVFFLAAARDAGYAIPLFAPPLTLLRQLHDKFAFARLAQACGIAVPHTDLLTSKAAVDALAHRGRDLVFKPCFSRFGTQTLIGPDAAPLASLRPTPQVPWVAQARLEGEECCTYAVARHGRLVAFCAYRPLHRLGKAASYYFEPIDLPDGEAIAGKLIEATGFDGQIAFDLIRAENGTLMPIECNPRATSGVHLFSGEPRLAERLLCDAPGTGVLRPPGDTMPAMVASAMWLFGGPKALVRGPSAWLRDVGRARDVLTIPGNPLNRRAWRVFGAYCLEAVRTGSSLRQIATADIEWNGEALDAGTP